LAKPPDYYNVGNSILTPELITIIQDTVWDVVSHHPYTGVPEPGTFVLVALCGLPVLRGRSRMSTA
jgi:hypothetical protein